MNPVTKNKTKNRILYTVLALEYNSQQKKKSQTPVIHGNMGTVHGTKILP